MHPVMILVALGLAWYLRLEGLKPTENWTFRFSKALKLFLLPPLLVITTLLAVLWMGPEEQTTHVEAEWFSYLLALSGFGAAVTLGLKLALEANSSVKKVRTFPQIKINGRHCRVLDTPVLFAAQIGFWQPELVVSQGLLDTLSPERLNAVLAHELGHYYYRDTFWFFWLGWMRAISIWLPNTEALWQELLVLRELRADRWAAKFVDSLLLAESLLLVVSYPLVQSENFCAFSSIAPKIRLQQRIDALLAEPESPAKLSWWSWAWLLPAFLPLAAIPFHR